MRHNLADAAKELGEIPQAVESMLESTGEFIDALEASIGKGEVEELDAVISSFDLLRADFEEFQDQVESLLSIFSGEYQPKSIDEIEEIEDSVRVLFDSISLYRARCDELAQKLDFAGFELQAERIAEVSSSLSDLPGSLRESFFTNQLFLAVKAIHFPEVVKDDIWRVAKATDSTQEDRRQNSYFILSAVASEYPEAVAPYADSLAENLSEATDVERQNILTTLIYVSRSSEGHREVGRNQAIELIDSNHTQVSLYAAMLLAAQSTTSKQTELISERIGYLLDASVEDTVLINATYLIYQLAETHPESVRGLVPAVAELLSHQNPSVQENTIEILSELNCHTYRDDIQKILDQTTDSDVKRVASEAVDQLEGDSSEKAPESSDETSSSSSILADIEEEFKL